MGSSSYDEFVKAIQSGDPGADTRLPLNRSIQPTAPISPNAGFLGPPLADVAYGMGGTDSAFFANPPAVDTTGAVVLSAVRNDLGRTIFDTFRAPPCWFWCQVVPGNVNPEVFHRIAIVRVGFLNFNKVAGVITTDQSFQMGTEAKRLEVTSVHIPAGLGLPWTLVQPGIIQRGIGTGASPGTRAASNDWVGPLYKPQGHCVVVAGLTAVTHTLANFIWQEIRRPDRPGA